MTVIGWLCGLALGMVVSVHLNAPFWETCAIGFALGGLGMLLGMGAGKKADR